MPIYLCCPASKEDEEPWTYGIQVYAAPFAIEYASIVTTDRDKIIAADDENDATDNFNHYDDIHFAHQYYEQQQHTLELNSTTVRGSSNNMNIERDSSNTGTISSAMTTGSMKNNASTNMNKSNSNDSSSSMIKPIRKIKHSEIIVVDDVCIAYNRCWLRIRFPGGNTNNLSAVASSTNYESDPSQHQYFAGYIAMHSVNSLPALSDTQQELLRGASSVVSVNNQPQQRQLSSFLRHSETTLSNSSTGEDDSNNNRSSLHTDKKAPFVSDVHENTGSDINVLAQYQQHDDDEYVMTTRVQKVVQSVTCRRTGIPYPSSNMLKLLSNYEDGVSYFSILPPPLAVGTQENVFCRICREGLHELSSGDTDYDGIPVPAVANDDTDHGGTATSATAAVSRATNVARTVGRHQRQRRHTSSITSVTDGNAVRSTTSLRHRRNTTSIDIANDTPRTSIDDDDADDPINMDIGDDEYEEEDADPPVVGEFVEDDEHLKEIDSVVSTALQQRYVGPVLPIPNYIPHSEALQNPMLKPCECSGSMAFVHYLCIEQWRCRSRHPAAKNGLNCETCNQPYTLPPPTGRRTSQNVNNIMQLDGGVDGLLQMQDNNDWLDAMPPHVMQALRQPHIMWQIGAFIVRKRYLRPVVPVIMSPIVAVYCRARRLLKKRGVARRRWACSLCRRRARWKCVRCLRSYYCSRQCQNVSWHIIHKHVCYKRVRFWWSIVVYSIITLLLCPGILRDPLMYDILICIIPLSFITMAILGGGIATIIKKGFGKDVRGRVMELLVLVCTIWLLLTTWGVVKGFFTLPIPSCYGRFGFTLRVTQYDIFPNLYTVTNEQIVAKTVPPPVIQTNIMFLLLSTVHYIWTTTTRIIRNISIFNLRLLYAILLNPAQKIYKATDRILLKSFARPILCSASKVKNRVSYLNNNNNTASILLHLNNTNHTQSAPASNIVTRIWNRLIIFHTNTNEKDMILFPNTTTNIHEATSTLGYVLNAAGSAGCFEHLSHANATFFISSIPPISPDYDLHSGKCASDLILILTLYAAALITFIGSIVYKRHERRQRHHHNPGPEHQQQLRALHRDRERAAIAVVAGRHRMIAAEHLHQD